MSKNYPVIGRIQPHKKNTCAKCRCGEIGTAKVHIELSFMRGEDEVIWACSEHKLQPEYLLGWEDKP
jgi:hypothetical protein